ncbi:MAG: Fe-S cluster assembly protein HesB [Bacillota bacterium]|jgi:HesB-like selenoprotein|nr:Fe-S cluster assembly protein HesB [Bacillota bacterium]
MEKLIISNEAYEEFKSFLDENKIEKYNIRISHAGSSCHGPAFNIDVDEPKEGDLIEKVNDINFIINPEIIDEFGIMTLLSTEENDGRGLSLRPLIESEAGCDGCSGCH